MSGLERAIHELGVAEIARRAGVSLTTVYNWRRSLPAERAVELETLLDIPREELRPDLYRRAPQHPQDPEAAA